MLPCAVVPVSQVGNEEEQRSVILDELIQSFNVMRGQTGSRTASMKPFPIMSTALMLLVSSICILTRTCVLIVLHR